MHPSKQALDAAYATWVANGPEAPANKRLEAAVRAAFAQHSPNGSTSWQGVVCLALVLAFIAVLLLW